jgi:sRNA-binding protein
MRRSQAEAVRKQWECPVTGGDAKIEQVLRDLLAAFPLAFSAEPRHVKPLAIGIRQQIYARCAFSHRSVGAALRRYANSPAYLRTIIEGAVRVDLDGAASENVTAMEAAHAAERITTRLAVVEVKSKDAIKPRTPANVNIVAPLPNRNAAKPGPRRLGRADLKRAAAARRTATT